MIVVNVICVYQGYHKECYRKSCTTIQRGVIYGDTFALLHYFIPILDFTARFLFDSFIGSNEFADLGGGSSKEFGGSGVIRDGPLTKSLAGKFILLNKLPVPVSWWCMCARAHLSNFCQNGIFMCQGMEYYRYI